MGGVPQAVKTWNFGIKLLLFSYIYFQVGSYAPIYGLMFLNASISKSTLINKLKVSFKVKICQKRNIFSVCT